MQGARCINVQPQGSQRQFTAMQRGIVAASLQLLHPRLQHLPLSAPARITQPLPGCRTPQHHGVGFRQRRQCLQRLRCFAGAQQQIAERNRGVQVVLSRKTARVGIGRSRIASCAFVAFSQQRQQPAALAGVGGLTDQRLQAFRGNRMPALQGLRFKAAGLGIKRLIGTRHSIASCQRFRVAGRKPLQRRQVQPALRMAGGACQRRRQHGPGRSKFMPALLHRGLQNGQIDRCIGPVPPGCQRRLRTSPEPRVAGLPGHGNILAHLLRHGGCRVGRCPGCHCRLGGAAACHRRQYLQHLIVPQGLHRSGRHGIEL